MTTAPPLLITSAIRPASAELVELVEEAERLKFLCEGVDNWLRIIPNIHIVICDGSDYDLTSLVASHWPDAQIEILFFSNNAKKVAQRGKGYGEGQIISYALKKSRTLKNTPTFMKCTSKLWVENVWEILEKGGPTQFHVRHRRTAPRKFNYTWVDTRFYVVEKVFYKKQLANAYKQVNRPNKKYIEHVFLERLHKLANFTEILMPQKPRIRGMSGTTGTRNG